MRRVKWKWLSLLPPFPLPFLLAQRYLNAFFSEPFSIRLFSSFIFSSLLTHVTQLDTVNSRVLGQAFRIQKRCADIFIRTQSDTTGKKARHVNKLNRFEMDCVRLNNIISWVSIPVMSLFLFLSFALISCSLSAKTIHSKFAGYPQIKLHIAHFYGHQFA